MNDDTETTTHTAERVAYVTDIQFGENARFRMVALALVDGSSVNDGAPLDLCLVHVIDIGYN